MEKTELKVQGLVNQIGIYNKTLNNYIDTFDIHYKTSKVRDLRDYRIITPEFYEFILSQREAIIEYQNDYYKRKSIKYIAQKINIDLNVVLDYFCKLDLENNQSQYWSRHVFNAFVKISNIRYPIGNIVRGFVIDIKDDEIISEISQDLFSLYKNKKLFKADTELNQLSSYEIKKGIEKVKL